MQNLVFFIVMSLMLFACAQNAKESGTDSEPEMKKVQTEDITKKMNKENFQEAKIKTATTPAPQSIVTCTAGSDVRVLEIKPVDNKGCELQYTKNGSTKTVANANFNLSYCESVQTRILKKLETAGFSCQ